MTDSHPTGTSSLLELGLEHHQAGRLDDAEQVYRAVLGADPDEPEALNLLGLILQERGELPASIGMLERAVAIDPDFAEAWANLARAQRAAGLAAAAAGSARTAVGISSDLPEAHLLLGRALLDLKDNKASAEACSEAVRLQPALAGAHATLGTALNRLRDFPGAIRAFRMAVATQPDDVLALIALGMALGEAGQFEESVIWHQKAADIAPGDVSAMASLATALGRAGKTERAIEACRQAAAIAPDRANLWTMLGSYYASMGRFDDSASCHRKALDIDPDSIESRRELVVIGGRGQGLAEFDVLHAGLRDPARTFTERAAAGFALGGEYDRLGDYDAAFDCYHRANQLSLAECRAQGLPFDAPAMRKYVDWVTQYFTSSTFETTRGWGSDSTVPVFIVGMPRSGTTLVEQIAASHPAVFGAGELMHVPGILDALANGIAFRRPETWSPPAVRQEAEAHVQRLQALGGDSRIVIDKLPDNVQTIGQIAILFPNAKIILCRRDLRDVCLSCFTQRFVSGMPWSHDLGDLAIRAREIERTVAHWKSVVPLPILEVHYEAMVGDLEGQARRLIDFLGLPWDPACLDFQKTERPVLTASRWQVRQPLYNTSVGRWRNYRRHLGPLLDGLKGLVPEDDDAQA